MIPITMPMTRGWDWCTASTRTRRVLLVIAKLLMPRRIWDLQFFNKTTKRKYRALVWGIVEENEGTVVGNIARNPRDRMQMAVSKTGDRQTCRYALPCWRLGYVTLVECVLETGRTRKYACMKHIGHVLFNDERYGGHEILKELTLVKYKQFEITNCFDICPRQALNAMTLGLYPLTPVRRCILPLKCPMT